MISMVFYRRVASTKSGFGLFFPVIVTNAHRPGTPPPDKNVHPIVVFWHLAVLAVPATCFRNELIPDSEPDPLLRSL
jgi:hypothetical protein